ncbi:MAG: hypothetical protein HOO99_09635 [Hyphomicrobiaceae bacterium]|nr:hypothetical protein [Hyphomicrobiaceae bacterium]
MDENRGAIDYRALDAGKIVSTIANLRLRIFERFPNAGLAAVCAELGQIAGESRARIVQIERGNWLLRGVVAVVIVGLTGLFGILVREAVTINRTPDNIYSVLQGVDALKNILVLIGAMVLFLITVEMRMKRQRALRALHELRSIIHVIDMHQLTKDPSAAIAGLSPTAHSPVRLMKPAELVRYLDYCSELLSLSAKVAALYAQSLTDAAVGEAVADIERLTTNLSQKMWQKIMIIENENNAQLKVLTVQTPAIAVGKLPSDGLQGIVAAPTIKR